MNPLKKWSAPALTIALLAVCAGIFYWYTSRTMVLDPAKLTPAETVESCPGAELSLTISGTDMALTFSNHSDARLESGAAVGGDRNFYFTGGLQVLLEDQWYMMPSEAYSTAGVGLELQPGDSVSGPYDLTPYGDLPDGAYRIAFDYRQRSPSADDPLMHHPYHQSYARFDVETGRYVIPNS